MIHLTPVQQIEIRKALMRVNEFASHSPESTSHDNPNGLVMGPQLDLFVDDVINIICSPTIYNIEVQYRMMEFSVLRANKGPQI